MKTKSFFKNKSLFLIAMVAILYFMGCSNDDNTNTTPSYNIYDFAITCGASQDCGDQTANNKTARVAWTKAACPVNSSTTYLSIGTGTITCTGANSCTGTVSNYTTAQLEEGDYTVVVYIDTDNSGTPNTGEPYECSSPFTISSSGSTQNFTLNSDL